ncbi:hypothetical protein ANN_22984, partial [Periplaneta americana]
LKNNEQWLDKEFVRDLNVVKPTLQKRGRPQAKFAGSSSRSKRRKTEIVGKSAESAESVTFAAKMKYRESGSEDHAKLLEEMDKTKLEKPGDWHQLAALLQDDTMRKKRWRISWRQILKRTRTI